MFTIEHTFDATVVTLVDEGAAPLGEDVVVHLFEEGAVLKQWDVRRREAVSVVLSDAQVRDLFAALDLPEGAYRRQPTGLPPKG
ncbi:hypothetical protein BCF33_2591 [Hasllibacter halocynthiae]|uniref:Phosphomannomutase n=1 Tax=Hasllibacter halocynthiae TaxID=595589 RepID=A0A2T0X437_9RHOB|nr:hypothetical protein [Hasllibacter halocynthiae]PRY93708.1 hypothetical protein BCF33_2591 [Hasllibacter halocynthiae]